MHLIGFIIRTYHDTRSHERQIKDNTSKTTYHRRARTSLRYIFGDDHRCQVAHSQVHCSSLCRSPIGMCFRSLYGLRPMYLASISTKYNNKIFTSHQQPSVMTRGK